MKDKIFSYKFKCVKCGICCTQIPEDVPIFYKDAERIAFHLNLDIKRFLKEYCKLKLHEIISDKNKTIVPLLYIKIINGSCVFYKNGCSIHSVKPYFCKTAPNISLLFQDDNAIKFFKKRCEGFGEGEFYSKKKIKSILAQEIKLETEEFILFNAGLYNDLLILFKD
jgi:Fe-S-cluster containining protein